VPGGGERPGGSTPSAFDCSDHVSHGCEVRGLDCGMPGQGYLEELRGGMETRRKAETEGKEQLPKSIEEGAGSLRHHSIVCGAVGRLL